MRDKIRTALRIAVYYGYPNLCISNFGLGPGFKNPAGEVAILWKEAFFDDPEFRGRFQDVVFAFDPIEGTSSSSHKSSASSSSSRSGSSKGSTSSSSSKGNSSSASSSSSDLDKFRDVFTPANIHTKFKANGYSD
jgi:hypothetical protein